MFSRTVRRRLFWKSCLCPALCKTPCKTKTCLRFTRELVDIESITGNEGPVGDFLHRELCRLGYQARKTVVEGTRVNVFATLLEQPHPAVVFSTHMDTVPPSFRPRKTQIASMDAVPAMPRELLPHK